jgi:tRNA-Thr(GGU) m(6)t(6)A37 methyltransferase TsaA
MTGGIRPGEKSIAMPPPGDAALIFIGQILTPWTQRGDCPRQGSFDGPLCQVVLDPVWAEALTGIEAFTHLQLLYWMDQARRDLVLLAPTGSGKLSGPFALRAPTRPNPIASSIIQLVERQESMLLVRGLDCVSGTPLLDIKPHRGAV